MTIKMKMMKMMGMRSEEIQKKQLSKIKMLNLI